MACSSPQVVFVGSICSSGHGIISPDMVFLINCEIRPDFSSVVAGMACFTPMEIVSQSCFIWVSADTTPTYISISTPPNLCAEYPFCHGVRS